MSGVLQEPDLFGHAPLGAVAPSARKRDPIASGYAAVPGTGPQGETCKSCRHLVRRQWGKTYLKCGLMRDYWTKGSGSDIRARAAACRRWEAEAQA